MSKRNPLRHARICWNRQRCQSRDRGIDFNLTFEEWYKWFLDQGVDRNIPQKNEGSAWCMARKNDQGPYEIGNIYLATMVQNCKDAHSNGRIPKGLNHPSYHKGRKINTPDGSFYIDEAAKYYKITPQAIRWRIKHNSKGFEYASP